MERNHGCHPYIRGLEYVLGGGPTTATIVESDGFFGDPGSQVLISGTVTKVDGETVISEDAALHLRAARKSVEQDDRLNSGRQEQSDVPSPRLSDPEDGRIAG